MVSINIDLPDELRDRAESSARSQGISLEDFLRSCISERLDERSKDPFYSDTAIFEGDTPADLSQEHAEYMLEGIHEAKEAIARGDVSPWDKQAFLAEMHEQHPAP